MAIRIGRREFVAALGGAAATWPLTARAQQAALPVVGFVSGRSSDASVPYDAAFRKGLGASGYIDSLNVLVEYHWLSGEYDRLPTLLADLVRRRVAVIVSPDSAPATLAAKAATTAIPIVFATGTDPVRVGLVASLARPGGNATGISFLTEEIYAKQMSLLHELVPKAIRIGLLINPANEQGAESILRNVSEAARTFGLELQVVNASTNLEIEAAFAILVHERVDALFLAADSFLASRRAQLATAAARYVIPTAQPTNRDFVEAGGLMSYGTDIAEVWHQVGAYTGQILKGAKPADLPVMQPTKFSLAINLQTARLFGLEVPAALLAIADEVIE
jgi:putative ABC transport system substrate-binding protein